jgi:hypothetical protein
VSDKLVDLTAGGVEAAPAGPQARTKEPVVLVHRIGAAGKAIASVVDERRPASSRPVPRPILRGLLM